MNNIASNSPTAAPTARLESWPGARREAAEHLAQIITAWAPPVYQPASPDDPAIIALAHHVGSPGPSAAELIRAMERTYQLTPRSMGELACELANRLQAVCLFMLDVSDLTRSRPAADRMDAVGRIIKRGSNETGRDTPHWLVQSLRMPFGEEGVIRDWISSYRGDLSAAFDQRAHAVMQEFDDEVNRLHRDGGTWDSTAWQARLEVAAGYLGMLGKALAASDPIQGGRVSSDLPQLKLKPKGPVGRGPKPNSLAARIERWLLASGGNIETVYTDPRTCRRQCLAVVLKEMRKSGLNPALGTLKNTTNNWSFFVCRDPVGKFGSVIKWARLNGNG